MPSSSPYSGHASRTSLEIYPRVALADAQESYDKVIASDGPGRYFGPGDTDPNTGPTPLTIATPAW